MEFPVNLVLRIENEQEYNLLSGGFDALASTWDDDPTLLSTFRELLEKMEYHRPDTSKEARILINGQEIVMGTLQDMQDRYNTECAMHSNSNVILQQWISGDWKQKAARRLQTIIQSKR